MGFEFLEEDKDIKGKSKAKKQHTRNGIQLLLLFFLFVCLFVCLFGNIGVATQLCGYYS
jgi:cell division protein FtsB